MLICCVMTHLYGQVGQTLGISARFRRGADSWRREEDEGEGNETDTRSGTATGWRERSQSGVKVVFPPQAFFATSLDAPVPERMPACCCFLGALCSVQRATPGVEAQASRRRHRPTASLSVFSRLVLSQTSLVLGPIRFLVRIIA